MPNWSEIYSNLFSGPVPAGQVTPQSDNVDLDDFVGVNKAKMQGGNDFADGNDQANVIFGNGGSDYLRGDGGDDSLHGGGHDDAIIGDDPASLGPMGNDLLWGGWGHDVIAGQGGNDNLDGGNGRDLLIAGEGNDFANGGMGADFIIGGDGNDTLLGGWNDDCLAGQLGHDSMRGGTGNDLMSGGDGNDTMYGGSHNDTMSGNAGHDYINAGNGHDVVYGNSGNDILRGWNGNDSIRGDCGDDAIDGGRADDLLLGDKGQDYITGGAGDDLIDGGKDADIIEGNDNADCIKGGEGDDLIYGDNANPYVIASGEASDLISGGTGNDTIHGGEDDDQINGDEDDDLIFGDSGNDTISGDAGDDTVDGGTGDDHISGAGGRDSLDGGSGNDIMAGGAHNDTMDGGTGDDCIDGGTGKDLLYGGDGADTINGGAGADTIDGGSGNDWLWGGDDGAEGDLIRGDAGQSGGGDDTLLGGAGNDTLDGGKGDDCLISGVGNDTLTGGGDADLFVFGFDFDADGDGECDGEGDKTILNFGQDVITDLNLVNGDRIMLHSDLDINYVGVDANDLLIWTQGGSIRLENAVLRLGLDPNDPDADFSSDALEHFITSYDPSTGEGKGFVYFGDKCVTLPDCDPDLPETGWEAEFPEEVIVTKELADKRIGDTTRYITEQDMAERYINTDVNVSLSGNMIIFDPDASTPPTVEVTPSTAVTEALDASAQVITDSGIVSFDDIDSTDTVTITYEVSEPPLWSHGDFNTVDPTLPAALIDAFHTGVEDAPKPGTTPWTYEGTFDLDFLAKDETITFTIDIIATDCDDASSRVPLTFTITGTNDAPSVEVVNNGVLNETTFLEDSDAGAQVLGYRIWAEHDDPDYNDQLVLRIDSNHDIAWSDGVLNAGLAAALESGSGLDGLESSAVDTPGGVIFSTATAPLDLDFLGEGETITWSYTVTATDPHGATDTDVANMIVTGTNDRPVAAALAFTMSEDDSSAAVDSGEGNVDPFAPLTGTPLTRNFEVTDDDVNDTHTFEIVGLTEISPGVYQTVDEFGNEYGKLYNNGDGTFTFDPEDDFQHLEEGESRDVTFQYQARDDSGVGTSPTGPSESELSAAQTVTITVEGAEDAPLIHTDELLFVTDDQSMWGTGDAIIFDPDLPFIGFDTGYVSLNSTIFAGATLSGSVLEGILGGIEAVANAFVDAGCEIASWFGGGCDDDPGIDLPSEINIPGVGTSGFFDARVGLQPYFSFNSGEVDADIPVDVVFNAPRQVEHGDTFNVQSAFTVDGGATFQTMSPNVNFGLDFVLDLAGNLVLDLFGADLTLIPSFDTGNISGFTGTQGEPGFNIFDVSGEDIETEIDLAGYGTLGVNFPVINTTGTPTNPPANTILESTGEDELVTLDLDIDALAAQLIELATGVPFTFGESGSNGLTIDVAGSTLNLISFDWSWDLLSVELLNTLKVVQDFTMSIEDLPLMAWLEDGTTITGISVGDDLVVSLGPDSSFDVDIHGDADGMLDFLIDIDMEAVLENLTTLGFDSQLFVGLLQLSGGISSDFIDDITISLFDGIIPSIDGNTDGFLYGDTFDLINDLTLATLYNDQFDVEGWNNPQSTTFDVDVA